MLADCLQLPSLLLLLQDTTDMGTDTSSTTNDSSTDDATSTTTTGTDTDTDTRGNEVSATL